MARQLVYTSAPVGLTPGRSGFCTVARHGDLRERLVSRIEAFSSYPADWRPPPVIYAFRWVDVAGTFYAVLSRLVEAGHDYTHRTNFIAHHLILDAEEAATAPRPADIILQWRGWLSRWDGGPRWMDDRDTVDVGRLPAPEAPPLPAQTWRELTGDAGHAALLTDNTRNATRGILRHTAAQEDSVLRMLRESASLLSPADAWRAPFITCLQASDSPAEFVWAGQRAKSPADMPRTGYNVLDLTAPASLPPPPSMEAHAAATDSSSPLKGLLGNFRLPNAPPGEAGVPRQFSRHRRAEPEAESASLHGIIWIGGGIVVGLCMAVLAWLLIFRDGASLASMSFKRSPNSTVTAVHPPSPAEILKQSRTPSAAVQEKWGEIQQLTVNGQYFDALDRWRNLENTEPQFVNLHMDFLKNQLLPAAQADWLNTLQQINTRLNEDKPDFAGMLTQLETMQNFPHLWPVADPVALDRAWSSTVEIFRLLSTLPNAPIWLVDDLRVAGAGPGYRDFTATVTIPALQTLLTAGELDARISAAPATSLALPLGGWFEFDLRPEDFARADYLILHDSTRGAVGGRYLQFFSEPGGKTRLVWRVFDENSDFFQRAPINASLKTASHRLWLRFVSEPPLPSFFLLLRRTDSEPATAWKALPGLVSWLMMDGTPADVTLPPWLTANLQLKTQPGQTVRLEPGNGGTAVAQSFDNAQARTAASLATVHYEAAWLMNVLDQQIRVRQAAYMQARDEVAKLTGSADSPNNQQARQTVEKMYQDLLALQVARAATNTAAWPRGAAPWRLLELRNSSQPLPILEFYPDETRPTP